MQRHQEEEDAAHYASMGAAVLGLGLFGLILGGVALLLGVHLPLADARGLTGTAVVLVVVGAYLRLKGGRESSED